MEDKSRKNSVTRDVEANGTLEQHQQVEAVAKAVHGHPVSEHPTTYCETLMHLLKGNIGCGMLAMGDAFRNGGLLMAPILTVFIGTVCIYNNHILLNVAHKLKSRLKLEHCPTFSETIELSFATGPKSLQKHAELFRTMVNVFVIITQLGFCCVYILFVSNSIKQFCDEYGTVLNIHIHMIFALLPIMSCAMIRNLKFIAPLSTAANISMAIALFIILSYCLVDLPPLNTRTAVAHWSQIPLFFGTAIYAFEGISLVLPLQLEMIKPNKFASTMGVLNVGMTIVTFIILTMGFVGFWRFGDEVKGSLTLNLPPTLILSKIVVGLMVFAIICTYTLQFYVPVAILWPSVQEKYGPFQSPALAEYMLRAALVFATFFAAEVIPHLALFISLVGAIASTFLALIFPPICHMVVWKDEGFGVLNWKLHMDIITILLGLLGCITGTYFSLHDIIIAFSKDFGFH